MLNLALVSLIVSIVAGLFGFGVIATGTGEIAQVLFILFLVLFLLTLATGLLRHDGP